MRRALDVWGFTPGFGVPHTDVRVVTADEVGLAGSYLPGPSGSAVNPADAPAVVVAHGFAGHRRKPAYRQLSERLSAVAAVLAIDLRGHGHSEGVCSLGGTEALDVLAAVGWLRSRGHRWVAVVGASLGGAAAIRAAGGAPDLVAARDPGVRPDAVCTISAVAQWGLRDTPAMRTLYRIVTERLFRKAAGRALHVRIADGWASPAQPVDVVGGIAPAPLLVVHGRDDHYYGPEQARLLYDAAGAPRRLWLEPTGFGHAEDGLTPEFNDRLAVALEAVHRDGHWPPNGHGPPEGDDPANS